MHIVKKCLNWLNTQRLLKSDKLNVAYRKKAFARFFHSTHDMLGHAKDIFQRFSWSHMKVSWHYLVGRLDQHAPACRAALHGGEGRQHKKWRNKRTIGKIDSFHYGKVMRKHCTHTYLSFRLNCSFTSPTRCLMPIWKIYPIPRDYLCTCNNSRRKNRPREDRKVQLL